MEKKEQTEIKKPSGWYNLEELKKEMLICALDAFSSRKEVAAELGITERTLYNYIVQYNIKQVVHPEWGLIYKIHT